MKPCFNPLHCGAVVASPRRWSSPPPPPPVSIPFIAGQWSLRAGLGYWSWLLRQVSIPFIAGQWSLPAQEASARAEAEQVSIPFIAGQWSLQEAGQNGDRRGGAGFNPLHCGAVVASPPLPLAPVALPEFQSPSLRGSGRFMSERGAAARAPTSFNPLHCGAVVASGGGQGG